MNQNLYQSHKQDRFERREGIVEEHDIFFELLNYMIKFNENVYKPLKSGTVHD